MKIVVLEGARGAGKSTIIRKLRDAMINTVAINFTGNREDTDKGKVETYKHFDNFLSYLNYESFDDSPFNFLLDRFFYSEMVYSTLYKSYDFEPLYTKLLADFNKLTHKKIEIVVIHLTTDKKGFERNLAREGKAHLFGDVKYADDVHKSLEQDANYERIFAEAKNSDTNIRYETADLSNLSIEESVEFVKSLI